MTIFSVSKKSILCFEKDFLYFINKNFINKNVSFLLLILFVSALPVPFKFEAMAYETKVQTVHLKTEYGIQLMQHWTEQAVGSFMAAVANKNLMTRPKHIILDFGDCTKKAKDIPQQAKCISKLLRNQITGKNFLKLDSKRRLKEHSQHKKSFLRSNTTDFFGSLQNTSSYNGRRKRAVIKRQKYELLSTRLGQMTPLGGVAQLLMNSVLAAKNKTKTTPWQETIHRLHTSTSKKYASQLDAQLKTPKGLLEHRIFKSLGKRRSMKQNLSSLNVSTLKLQVLPTEKSSNILSVFSQKLVNLLRDGFKLAWSLAGRNSSEFNDKTIKAVSPRFFSVVPEEESENGDVVNVLSPSLFSLHGEGKGIEGLSSLPNLMKDFNNKDHQAWMNFIMEASGVTEETEKVDRLIEEASKGSLKEFQKQYQNQLKAKDGTPLYFTKENVTKIYGEIEEKKITVFENLNGNLSSDQIHDLNETGYVLLTPFQLTSLYGPQSPYSDGRTLCRLKKLNNSILQHTIEEYIHNTAQLKSFNIRLKRQTILSPSSFATVKPNPGGAVLLSPIIFSPAVFAPAILGPLILSPSIFLPVILSPRALSPLILSPLAFVPFILSPVVLHPVILSPGAFVPILLTPIALSPFVMSPQVFSPFILTPFVLSPFILNPSVGSPLVLSPFALSPTILSPQIFGALILSPYALSPVISSPLVAYTVLLSPSYLS